MLRLAPPHAQVCAGTLVVRRVMQIEVAARFHGPPGMGHGGYVAGLLAERVRGGVQVTLRQPTPLDTPLDVVDRDAGGVALLRGDALVADAEPAELAIEVPPAPTLEQAHAAVAGSPSFYFERGVHPTCFGCAAGRAIGDGLRIFVGPCEVGGHPLVAAPWTPGPSFADDAGEVPTRYVLASLDCPGAFAFIVRRERAGLLGRIGFVQHGRVRAQEEHVVVGWRIGSEGRKLFAGTALFDAGGTCLAVARATWFGPRA